LGKADPVKPVRRPGDGDNETRNPKNTCKTVHPADARPAAHGDAADWIIIIDARYILPRLSESTGIAHSRRIEPLCPTEVRRGTAGTYGIP
jgi:hypothetical protein